MRRLRRLTRVRLRAAAVGGLALLLIASAAPHAFADGDPGSDVLVYQSLFAESDAGLSVAQQAQLGALLKASARGGAPIRVAVIAAKSDLGAVTALWQRPRDYARFLGIELSLAYTQRLLVVMPDGLGFSWYHHSPVPGYRALAGISVRPGATGLLAAAETAVVRLDHAAGVALSGFSRTSPQGASPVVAAASRAAGSAGAGPQHGLDQLLGTIGLAALALIALAMVIRRLLPAPVDRDLLGMRRGRSPPRAAGDAQRVSRRVAISAGALLLAGLAAAVMVLVRPNAPSTSSAAALATNPELDPGTPVSGPAPGFTLSDQFGRPVSLRGYRGHVVLLAFNDSECTTVCPLTTTAMLDAKAMLGAAGRRVQLVGIDANPKATSLQDVWSYSELHGMLHAWRFLTGSLPVLRHVWQQYKVEAAIEQGQITHTPALFVIGPGGRFSRLYVTQMSYTAVPQLAQLLARSASALLPGRPAVRADVSYTRITPITPGQFVTVPRAGGGSIRLGPSASARLFVFYATWDRETTGLGGQLDALNRYEKAAVRTGLPRLTAVDESSVEPSARTVTRFLAGLPRRLDYPVAVDRSGRLADGYQVLGLPWLLLVSKSGRILYYREISTAGWPSTSVLIRYVKAALARAPDTVSEASRHRSLADAPAPLSALHRQAGQLIADNAALDARIRALRGYPIVVNAWASWCGPCRQEFSLFASASVLYGRQVAFLGADTEDSPGDARAFLAQHPVSYPSYPATISGLSSFAVIDGLPTTIYINARGKVVDVHTGQYDAQGTLDQDITTYALHR